MIKRFASRFDTSIAKICHKRHNDRNQNRFPLIYPSNNLNRQQFYQLVRHFLYLSISGRMVEAESSFVSNIGEKDPLEGIQSTLVPFFFFYYILRIITICQYSDTVIQ